jgi:hypothetical protein
MEKERIEGVDLRKSAPRQTTLEYPQERLPV